MGFSSQSENLDPLKFEIPYSPFLEATNIAWRAQALLRGRTSDDVRSLATTASESIDSYFQNEKDEEVDRLARDRNEEFIEFEYDKDGGTSWHLRPEKEDELEIATAENTTEIEALRLCIDSWGELESAEVTDAKPYEYFATMALCHIADYLQRRSIRHEFRNGRFLKTKIETLDTTDYQRIADYLFKALEAVCYAEQLRNEERLERVFQQRIDARLQSAKQSAYDQAAKVIRSETVKQIKEEEARLRSEHGKELSRLRHRDTYEARTLVLNEWAKDPNGFSSAEKAGNHFADWLTQHDHKFEPRTVIGWIRAYAKEKGIRFR